MLLGFKARFVSPIQIGTKVFTMRNKRKNPPKIGETLYMYTGLRTNKCQKISDKEILISIQEVKIYIEKSLYKLGIYIKVDNRPLEENEIDEFVRFDGFKDRTDFADYWIKSSGAKGPVKRIGGELDLFHWTDLKY